MAGVAALVLLAASVSTVFTGVIHHTPNLCQLTALVLCFNGGTCEPNGAFVKCICPPLYTGSKCETKIESEEPDGSGKALTTQTAQPSSENERSQTTLGLSTDEPRQIVTEASVDSSKQCLAGLPLCKHGAHCTDKNTAVCLPNWTGPNCCHRCPDSCDGTGRCSYSILPNRTFGAQCVCEPYYRYVAGRGCVYNCEFEPEADYCPEDKSALYTALGATIGACVLLLVLFCVLVYFLWRRRVLWAQQLVYLFLPYVDDKEKTHAYVSFASSGIGNDFVIRQLVPKLEDEKGFSLLLHHRDGDLGAAIQDNILEAIERSSRVILVLSRDFANNEWQLFESQAAFHQMLKRKTKILPLLLDTSKHDPELEPGLKYLISSVTTLQVPITNSNLESSEWNKFWSRLNYAMPKVRSKDDRARVASRHQQSSVCEKRNGSKTDSGYCDRQQQEDSDSIYDKITEDDIAPSPPPRPVLASLADANKGSINRVIGHNEQLQGSPSDRLVPITNRQGVAEVRKERSGDKFAFRSLPAANSDAGVMHAAPARNVRTEPQHLQKEPEDGAYRAMSGEKKDDSTDL